MAAIFNDGAGGRDEDELAEGAVGGIDGNASDMSGKCFTVVDDCLYTFTAATSQHIDHMSRIIDTVTKRLQDAGKIGSDKSSKKMVAKKVATINRISQQAILKALSLDN